MSWLSLVVGLLLGFVIGALGGKSMTNARTVSNLLDTCKESMKGMGDRLELGQSVIFTFTVGKFLNDEDDGGGGDEDETPIEPIFEQSWRNN